MARKGTSQQHEGLRLAARYSYIPNHLGYCGPPDAEQRLLDYVIGGSGDGVRKALTQFEALHPYLKLIAGANGKEDEFDRDVVEALWVGNRLLDKVDTDGLRATVGERFKGYLPLKVLTCIVAAIPDGALPHHSFHVLHIQTVTGVISKTVENQDKCRISWGRVVAKGEKLTVETDELALEDGRYVLNPCVKEVEYKVGADNYVEAGAGDWVAVHWGLAVDVLDEDRLANLKDYTKRNLELIKPPPYLKD